MPDQRDEDYTEYVPPEGRRQAPSPQPDPQPPESEPELEEEEEEEAEDDAQEFSDPYEVLRQIHDRAEATLPDEWHFLVIGFSQDDDDSRMMCWSRGVFDAQLRELDVSFELTDDEDWYLADEYQQKYFAGEPWPPRYTSKDRQPYPEPTYLPGRDPSEGFGYWALYIMERGDPEDWGYH